MSFDDEINFALKQIKDKNNNHKERFLRYNNIDVNNNQLNKTEFKLTTDNIAHIFICFIFVIFILKYAETDKNSYIIIGTIISISLLIIYYTKIRNNYKNTHTINNNQNITKQQNLLTKNKIVKPLSQNQINKVVIFFDNRCCICGENNNLHVHHINQRSEGGGNNIENLIVLCPNHHSLVHSGGIPKSRLLLITKLKINEKNKEIKK